MDDYTAASIKILDPEETERRFGFARAQALAQEYPWVPRDVIERMLAAAQMSGTDEDLVIRRYCAGQAWVQIPDEMHACYAELVQDARRSRQRCNT
mgnify:CR=1 FL=1